MIKSIQIDRYVLCGDIRTSVCCKVIIRLAHKVIPFVQKYNNESKRKVINGTDVILTLTRKVACLPDTAAKKKKKRKKKKKKNKKKNSCVENEDIRQKIPKSVEK